MYTEDIRNVYGTYTEGIREYTVLRSLAAEFMYTVITALQC